MQTFLSFADFEQSARVLDRQRLGKQRMECGQILSALLVPEAGWKNHPAARMWAGHEPVLCVYMHFMIEEWKWRGYKNTTQVPWHLVQSIRTVMPPWLGDEEFHRSHRSNLLRKDPVHYGQFGWTEPSDLPYIWPSKEKKYMTKKTLESYQTLHAEMLATASDLGYSVPDNLATEFETAEAGEMICDELDAQIKKFREGLDETQSQETEEVSSESGQEALASADEQEHTPAAPARKPPRKSSTKKPKADKKADASQPKEAEVAAPKKTAKTAAKPAKKTAAKAPAAKKAASDNARTPRVTHDESHKITWLADGNPCRAGSARFDRYEKLRKCSGKTVKTALASGVPSATLTNAMAQKIIKIGA